MSDATAVSLQPPPHPNARRNPAPDPSVPWLPATPEPPTDPPAADNDDGGGEEKLSVNLIARARRALARRMKNTGWNKTVVTNRALILLDEAESAVEDGGRVLILDKYGQTRQLFVL